MKKSIGIAILIILITVAAVKISGSITAGRTPAMVTATARVRSFDVTISETGVMQALRSVTLSSQIRSNRAKIVYLVPEGTQVEAGEIVIQFDPTPFQEDIQRFDSEARELRAVLSEVQREAEIEAIRVVQERNAAKHAVRLAELQLQNVLYGEGPVSLEESRSNAIQSKTNLDNSIGHVRDLELLHAEGFVNDEELKRARNAAEEAESAHKLARLRYESRRDYTYPADQEKAQAELAQAKNAANQLEMTLRHRQGQIEAAIQRAQAALEASEERLRLAKSELEKTDVKAPIPGFVVYREAHLSGELRKPRVGDSVWMNEPIIILPDITRMVVESRVREVDIHKIKMGQKVEVRVDAYPDVVHTGKVDLIGTLATTDPRTRSAAKYFNLRVLIDESDTRLRPGMTAHVNIHVERVENKLAVPINVIFRDGPRTLCYVWDGANATRREVITGISDGINIVVESGLQENERVCLTRPPADLIVEGRRE